MPRPVRLGRGIDYVPTSVFMEKDGCFYFGADADDQSVAAPRNYRRAFKLDIGTSTYLLSVRTEKERQRFTAADLTQKFLEYILQQCAEKSYPCDRAVVTRPVDFSPLQEKQLQEAAMSAGLKEIIFITEPEAAGYAYRMESPDTTWQNALVVDWGGGTLDMALVSQSGNELHANKRYRTGISCGGENFDDALRLLATQIIRTGSDASVLKEDEMDLSWIYNSRRQFRKEKELLSEQSSRILRLVSHDGIPYQPVKLNRQDFEIGIMPELQRAAKMAKDLIASIEERSLKPEFILLVGGSSQIPAVKRILEQETGLKCRTFDQGNEAVSLGAALYAHKLWGKQTDSPAPQREATILKTERWYDDPQVLEWYKKGVAAGHPESLYQVGCFYLHKGEMGRAKNLLCAAAGGGHPDAKTILQRFWGFQTDSPAPQREATPPPVSPDNSSDNVFIEVKPNDIFSGYGKMGLNCTTMQVPLTLAAQGGVLSVPTSDGAAVKLKLPAGTSSGTAFRVRGRGMPSGREGIRGDLIVEIQVETPTNILKTERWYDDPQVLEWYKKGAASGHPESLYQVGCFYLHKGEVGRAKNLLCAAAGGGHPGAKTMLQRFWALDDV